MPKLKRKRHATAKSSSRSNGRREVESHGKKDWCKTNYVVEAIVDHYVRRNERYYLVKWEGWGSEYNTWEPEANLNRCEDRLADYVEYLRDQITFKNAVGNNAEEVFTLKKKLVTQSNGLLEKYIKTYLSPVGKSVLNVSSEAKIHDSLKSLLDNPVKYNDEALMSKLREEVMTRAFDMHRMVQLHDLKKWEEQINEACGNRSKIHVENDVDLEGPPANFTYINDSVPGQDVVIPDDPPIGCSCSRTRCSRLMDCCGRQFGSRFAYYSDGRVGVEPGTAIYECNRRCTCDATCPNRVVQHGAKCPLSIFRTSNGCGWGVKARRLIKKGTFVCEYVGEVIKSVEAERRGRVYDAEGRTYLFDLDFNDALNPYTIDAAFKGNVAHFINHSCEPNLAVFAVWIDCLDPNLPKLALFAKKDVAEGQELTFDYQCQTGSGGARGLSSPRSLLNQTLDSASPSPTVAPDVPKTKCRCGTVKCRKLLF